MTVNVTGASNLNLKVITWRKNRTRWGYVLTNIRTESEEHLIGRNFLGMTGIHGRII
jgi:hypothetical protein